MRSAFQVAGLLALAVSIGFADQKNSKPPKNPPAPRAAERPAPPPAGRGGGTKAGANPGRGNMNTPLNPVQRFLNMTPEEQHRVLEKAPPAQRARLEEALDKWNAKPEAQKQFAYRQYRSLTQLPPDKQMLVQRQMVAFNHLPDERKKPVRQELIRLLDMSAEQRPSRFASPEFAQKYSPAEQQILKDLSTTLPADYPLARR